MTWTDRADTENRCNGPRGGVGGSELVARLLTSKMAGSSGSIFTRNSLDGRKNAGSNVCGQSDGISVDRCADLSNGEIIGRAHAFAVKSEGRVSLGALLACVQSLRDIRLVDVADEQLVFVYDDPATDNDRHAVIRTSAIVPPTRFGELRDRIAEHFGLRLQP